MNNEEMLRKIDLLKKEQKVAEEYYTTKLKAAEEYYVDKIKEIQKSYDEKIEVIKKQVFLSPSERCSAAEAWCRLTNALIRKYKPMSETDPDKTIKEITQIEGCLLTGGFLTKEQLKEAL